MKTIDRGTPRIAREITAAPLTLRVDGTVIPWDRHTAVTITRQARHGRARDSVNTAQLTITAPTLLDLPQRAWLTCELTAAAAAALSAPTSSRYRFAGRLTDVDLAKPSPTGPARYDLTAAGTLAAMRDDADTITAATWAGATNAFYIDPLRPHLFPPTTYWPTLTLTEDYSGTLAFSPGDIQDVYSSRPTLRDVLADVVDSHPAALLAEYRDGSVRFTDAGSGTVSTLPAPAALSFPRRWPTNDVTVTYGPAPDGAIIARQLIRNPAAQTSTSGYLASGGTHSYVLDAVQFTQTAAGYSTAGSSSAYSAARDGKVRAAWWVEVAPNSTGTATLSAVYNNGSTVLGSTVLASWSGNPSGSVWRDEIDATVIDPPAGANIIALRVDLPSGWVASGSPAIRWQRASLVTLGPGSWTPADVSFTDGRDFDGSTPAEGPYRYEWSGTVDNSVSYRIANGPAPVSTRATDPTSIAAHGRNPAAVTALISADYPATAYTLAASMLDAGGWDPPPITLDVLALLESGQAALARSLLALELGARIAVTALPSDTPQDLTDPTACYVAGLRETIAPGSWRVTITPAVIP